MRGFSVDKCVDYPCTRLSTERVLDKIREPIWTP